MELVGIHNMTYEQIKKMINDFETFKDYSDDLLDYPWKELSESTQLGLRCGGKTMLAMGQTQQEFLDSCSISDGTRRSELVVVCGGGRSQGKSSFENMFIEDNPMWNSLRGGGKTCLGMDLWYREMFGESFWTEPDWLEGEWVVYTLMKTKSKQSRYVRVWRNK